MTLFLLRPGVCRTLFPCRLAVLHSIYWLNPTLTTLTAIGVLFPNLSRLKDRAVQKLFSSTRVREWLENVLQLFSWNFCVIKGPLSGPKV
jgi:hypothetical protein